MCKETRTAIEICYDIFEPNFHNRQISDRITSLPEELDGRMARLLLNNGSGAALFFVNVHREG